MIFPEHCKYVGFASTQPCGNKVYFLSRYLVHQVEGGFELLAVELDPNEKGMMRHVISSRLLAPAGDVCQYPEKVQIHDRTRLISLARDTGYRCTLFTGLDEHLTFVLDPDLSGLLRVHVYDVSPPRPSLSACIRELEADGLFGELGIEFCHHVLDISRVKADVYPCRAAGFSHTLDNDMMQGNERVAGCLTGTQLFTECYGREPMLENICPLAGVQEEPFIARCCRSEREGVGSFQGRFGAVVHWGASPRQIAESISALAEQWREHDKDRNR